MSRLLSDTIMDNRAITSLGGDPTVMSPCADESKNRVQTFGWMPEFQGRMLGPVRRAVCPSMDRTGRLRLRGALG
jgi:hypothetical protein